MDPPASASKEERYPSENRKESLAESACLPPWSQRAAPSTRHVSECLLPPRKPLHSASPRRCTGSLPREPRQEQPALSELAPHPPPRANTLRLLRASKAAAFLKNPAPSLRTSPSWSR